ACSRAVLQSRSPSAAPLSASLSKLIWARERPVHGFRALQIVLEPRRFTVLPIRRNRRQSPPIDPALEAEKGSRNPAVRRRVHDGGHGPLQPCRVYESANGLGRRVAASKRKLREHASPNLARNQICSAGRMPPSRLRALRNHDSLRI